MRRVQLDVGFVCLIQEVTKDAASTVSYSPKQTLHIRNLLYDLFRQYDEKL